MIVGQQKITLLDYPGEIATIFFTQGCNLKCGYCHNPELIPRKADVEALEYRVILEQLNGRKGKLSAVVITGGEPALHFDSPQTIDFLQKVREMGFKLKLDTNGTILLTSYLPHFDYVAMDIKGSPHNFQTVSKGSVYHYLPFVQDNIAIVMNSGIKYEFRTTIVDELFEPDDIHEIGKMVDGAALHFLQKGVHAAFTTPTDNTMAEYASILSKYVEQVKIR